MNLFARLLITLPVMAFATPAFAHGEACCEVEGAKPAFVNPVDVPVSTSYGTRKHPVLGREIAHQGVDYKAHHGTPVVAAQDGEVIFVGWYGGYGKSVVIHHGGELVTLYAHNASTKVEQGQKVKQGDLIAHVGATGMSVEPHLHFEVREGGKAVDPAPYLPKAE